MDCAFDAVVDRRFGLSLATEGLAHRRGRQGLGQAAPSAQGSAGGAQARRVSEKERQESANRQEDGSNAVLRVWFGSPCLSSAAPWPHLRRASYNDCHEHEHDYGRRERLGGMNLGEVGCLGFLLGGGFVSGRERSNVFNSAVCWVAIAYRSWASPGRSSSRPGSAPVSSRRGEEQAQQGVGREKDEQRIGEQHQSEVTTRGHAGLGRVAQPPHPVDVLLRFGEGVAG